MKISYDKRDSIIISVANTLIDSSGNPFGSEISRRWWEARATEAVNAVLRELHIEVDYDVED